VTAAKVANGSLTAAKINVPSLNIPGPLTFTIRTVSKDFDIPAGGSEQLLSPCEPGEEIVGGGSRSSNASVVFSENFPSAPSASPHSWFARGLNVSGQALTGTQIQSVAVCAKR
jgi:hypothetical protein